MISPKLPILGKPVWFDAGIGFPIAGEVVELTRSRISIKSLVNGKIFVFGIDETSRFGSRIPLPPEGVNDMITMSDLSEASILWNIKVRYDHRQFYTYIGSILVAVNPYYMHHDMYSIDFVRKYENALVLHAYPAHIFATSSVVHSKMLSDKINQCVVISGESGGGKTQSTKLIMNYLAAVNPGKNKLITEQILEASPLLESFGNAKTVRNDNSSRFGKYIEIYYSQKSIVGAKLSDFLLEKSRIVTHSNDERNYHVFYELLEGFDIEEKRKYGLTTPEKYFYLNQGSSIAITSKSDAHDFQSLLTAMNVLNFTKTEQETIFKILATILHLGNIYFSRTVDDPSHELVQISSKSEIEWCSHLLAINEQGLLQKLTHKVTEARDERLLSPFNLEQALDSRDAIAKALYATLFSWLVARINQIVRVNSSVDNSIAILDIFGFENFSTNSFEQLCINYANEALQFHFNQHVFKLEQEEYAKEKLAWKKIDFADNTDCLDLIGKKPNGILQILDDESNFPKATDQSFLHKCHRIHESNRLYGKPRLLKTTFSIRHYAGEVEYDVCGFLDKNRDLLRSDVIDLLSSSRNEILADMFRDIREVYESHRGFHFKTGRFITMKAKTPTVSAKFSDSLANLIDTMTRCQPTFIRCIKPNNDKTPNKLELTVVLEQLRNTGMLETVRIRKLGFPRRYSFDQFAKRYRCLMSNSLVNSDPKEITIHILNNLPTKFTSKYQIGVTKVFMRESLEHHLEKERTQILNDAALTIQRTMKGYFQRKNFEKQRRAILILQRQYRRWMDSKKTTGSPAVGRFQRRPSLGTSIARAMISMSPDVTFDKSTDRSSSLTIKLSTSLETSTSRTSCFSQSTALSNITCSSSTLHSLSERLTTSTSPEYQTSYFSSLEIPSELNTVFTRLDGWQEPHSEECIIETPRSANVIPCEKHLFPLTNNTGASPFLKYVQENTTIGTKWDRVLTPIKEPFTKNVTDQQHIQLALSLFKLILRFINTSEQDAKRDRALGDYIVQMGLTNEILRDEILIQIINQIWNNVEFVILTKAWLLMLNCIGCFSPSTKFHNYLLKFISEEDPLNNELGKRKLLAASAADAPRTYPPTQLEWTANKRSIPMALQAEFHDNFQTIGEVESWMTGEEYAYELVQSRGILKDNCFGWTVLLEDNDIDIELMGHDYVLDLIGEIEIPPYSPVCKSYFLVHDGPDRSSKSQSRRHHRAALRSKEWFLKVDNSRSSRLSKKSRNMSSSNHSSPYKYPRRYSSEDQQQQKRIEKTHSKVHSPVYHDVASKKSNSSVSSYECPDGHQSFPPPPSTVKDFLKFDTQSAYSITDGPKEEVPIEKHEVNKPVHQRTPPLPPLPSSTRSSKEKTKFDDEIKPVEKRVQLSNYPSINKTNSKAVQLSINDRKGSIRKTNTFTSSSHSMVDAGCGGHIISKIPALRCFRPTKQQRIQKSYKTPTSSTPPRAVSNAKGTERPTSFYGEGSAGSDAQTNLNQYEKIGSSIHNAAKTNNQNDEYHLSSVYSDADAHVELTEYEAEDVQAIRKSPTKDTVKAGNKFVKNKMARQKSAYPPAKKQGNTIFDCESIATITDLPLPCHKSDVEAFLDDLFDRALDPKSLGKKNSKAKALSALDQHRLQMISNSRVDPTAVRRAGLASLLHKENLQKKSSIRVANTNSQKGSKKTTKTEKKDSVECKKPSKTKKKRSQNLNTNNNNNNTTLTDQSVSSFTSENRYLLPQIGYSSRTETDDASDYPKCLQKPKNRTFSRQSVGVRRTQRFDRIRHTSIDCNQQKRVEKCSNSDKKNIKLIPINPAVCFATTAATTPVNKKNELAEPTDSNGPVFVPVINISGKKYLPVYLKQATDENKSAEQLNQSDQMPYHSDKYISQLLVSNNLNTTKKTPTIVEENETETQSNPSPMSLKKPNIQVERLSMSQLDLVSAARKDPPKKATFFKESPVQNKYIKVPSNIFTRRSPEAQKYLRAKTVRIGKIRWPPPLDPEEVDNANQQRRMLVQRRIQEEIHGNKTIQQETQQTVNITTTITTTIDNPLITPDQSQRSQNFQNIKPLTVEPKVQNNSRLSSVDRVISSSTNEQQKKSSIVTSSLEQISQMSDHVDDDPPTDELVARNLSNLEFHRTMSPMIGKENFELRKKLFEHPEEPSVTDVVPPIHEIVNTLDKPLSRQSYGFLTYQNVPWKLKVRKEIFSPTETFDQPLLIDLLYLQIVHDVFSAICTRISEAERTNMKTFLSSHGVRAEEDANLINKLMTKKAIIDQARQWLTYFCRFFPVSIPKFHSGEIQMLGISHSGIRLVKRMRKKASIDTLEVLETYSFDNIEQISPIRNGSTIDLRLSKRRITIHSHRIQKITQLIDKFLKEARVVKNKRNYTPVRKNHYEKVSPPVISNTSDLLHSSSQCSFLSGSQTFSELIPSASFDVHTPKPTQNDIFHPNSAALPAGYSMMEFALRNFHVPHKRQSKKTWKNSDWTWQDYAELLKWSKSPIQSPLLRHTSGDNNRIIRQTFVAVMRFMGDHPMSRGQTDIDCLYFLLKNMHKNRPLIDEIVCQIIKQLTENKSTRNESLYLGWKLLAIILNYFIPSENLRPYFVKYLNDNIPQNENLVKLCLSHYEQTLKYGGRKNTPSKAEIDLLAASGRSGTKRQIFLLPGGIPSTLKTTASMVISDCLNLICEQLHILNNSEHDEYSIFIISASENSSRLLNPNEYLFDILSECVRGNITDYHLIVKRMLWFNIPMTLSNNNQSEIYIHCMYNQILPEFLDGTMIILKNNHMSDDLMHQVALMAALEFHAADKTGLPSMREVKHLLPATVLKLKNVRPQVWTTTVHEQLYATVESMTMTEAKIKFLNIIQTWHLFGVTFFNAQSVDDTSIRSPCIIGISKHGILFLDIDTRETLFSILYNDVVSIRRHQQVIDIKYGSLTQPQLIECQVEKAHDLVALAGRYLSFVGRSLSTALARKANSQQLHRSTTTGCNDPISTIL